MHGVFLSFKLLRQSFLLSNKLFELQLGVAEESGFVGEDLLAELTDAVV